MLAMVMNVNIFLVAGLVILSGIMGFALRGAKISSLKKKLSELENEMLLSHADILQLQKEKILLMKEMSQPVSPVIPITGAKDEKNGEKLPDVSGRKKLLNPQQTPSVKQQSGS